MSPRSGRGLAVLGSFLGAAPEVAAAVEDGAAAVPVACRRARPAGALRRAAAPAPAPHRSAQGSRCTSFSVMTRGGFVVTMVAVSLSLSRKSEMSAGWPPRMILTPRLSMSLCVNILSRRRCER